MSLLLKFRFLHFPMGMRGPFRIFRQNYLGTPNMFGIMSTNYSQFRRVLKRQTFNLTQLRINYGNSSTAQGPDPWSNTFISTDMDISNIHHVGFMWDPCLKRENHETKVPK